MLRLAIAGSLLSAACSFSPHGLDPSAADATDVGSDAPLADGPAIDGAALDAPTAIDARVIDAAPPPDAPTCPTSYPGGYRYISSSSDWLTQERACEADQPGRTHLVVIDNVAEGGVVIGVLSAVGSGNDVWVGVVRDPAANWRWVTGGNAAYLPWASGQPDLGNQYVVRVDKFTGAFYDRGTSDHLPALCECDGRPPVNADYDPSTN